MGTPVANFNCPSRRQAKAYPNLSSKRGSDVWNDNGWFGMGSLGTDMRSLSCYDSTGVDTHAVDTDVIACSDYAGNEYRYTGCPWCTGGKVTGSSYNNNSPGAAGLKAAEAAAGFTTFGCQNGYPFADATWFANHQTTAALVAYNAGLITGQGGMIFPLSMVAVDDVKDGTSNTMIVGEKFMQPWTYENGAAHGDSWAMYSGDDCTITRSCGGDTQYRQGITRDVDGFTGESRFGSCHAGGANFVFCDGSVHQVSYGVDKFVMDYLGNRNDGQATDANNFNM
jgi:prepilin-type processing-associated H-X9-DG protein